MSRKLTIVADVECGEKTCASEPGKFCRFVLTSHFGQQWHCGLFTEIDRRDSVQFRLLKEEGGWLMRHAACLAAEHDKAAR